MSSRNGMAASATLHCLTGCAIGEIVGLMIGTAMGLNNAVTIALAIVLAFLFGYTLSTLPLIQAGLGFFAALSVVFAADTLSIAVMELVDNMVMAIIPGAMDAGLVNTIFWIGMMIALTAAFFAAFPVNRYLIDKGKGHALTHQFMHGTAAEGAHSEHHAHESQATGHPTRHSNSLAGLVNTNTLAAGLVGFLLGGLTVSIAAELDNDSGQNPTHGSSNHPNTEQ